MREIEGGVIKGWVIVQRRQVRVGAVLSVLGGVGVGIEISRVSLGLLIMLTMVMLLVSSVGRVVSHEDRASDGF